MTRAVVGHRSWRRWVPLIVAVAIAGAAHSRMDTSARVERGRQFVPSPEHARLSALGFDAAVADYYWLTAVQIVGGSDGQRPGTTELLGRLIDVVTTLDPWVDHPYRFAAIWLTESVDDVLEANRLLERGISYHPTDWRNRHYLGFNHFFYLGDDERAAEILEKAVHLDGAPSYLGGLVARLRSGADGLETAAALLAEFAASARDEYARASYLKSLDEVETERAARYLDAARLEFWKRNGRDIRDVSELAAGPRPVIPRLPKAHPNLPGFQWELDQEGTIVSSYYGYRYQLHMQTVDRERMQRWHRNIEADSGGRT